MSTGKPTFPGPSGAGVEQKINKENIQSWVVTCRPPNSEEEISELKIQVLKSGYPSDSGQLLDEAGLKNADEDVADDFIATWLLKSKGLWEQMTQGSIVLGLNLKANIGEDYGKRSQIIINPSGYESKITGKVDFDEAVKEIMQ